MSIIFRMLMDNNTIETPMGTLINLECAFLETTGFNHRDTRIVAYVEN